MSVRPFTDEQARVLINLTQHYEVWIEAEQAIFKMPYNVVWKSVGGREYLYQVLDRANNGKSLGRRSPKTEEKYEAYHSELSHWQERRDESYSKLAESCQIYRSLRLPMLEPQAAKVLREIDRRQMLGNKLLVVGTNCMAAYCAQAGGFIQGSPMETDDFDMALRNANTSGAPVWAALKAVDSTYTVNSERPFQARNSKAHEVELLVAPSQFPGKGFSDSPRPIPLPEQEWLLLGHPISQVVVARDASPCRILAPDPRYFALQKLWLSKQDKRNALKRPKDERQGNLVLDAVVESMPLYRLDAEFEASLPAELAPLFREWKSNRAAPTVARRW